MTTLDIEDLFRDWNTERQTRISSNEGGVTHKWCEDQLTKIINTRYTTDLTRVLQSFLTCFFQAE